MRVAASLRQSFIVLVTPQSNLILVNSKRALPGVGIGKKVHEYRYVEADLL